MNSLWSPNHFKVGSSLCFQNIVETEKFCFPNRKVQHPCKIWRLTSMDWHNSTQITLSSWLLHFRDTKDNISMKIVHCQNLAKIQKYQWNVLSWYGWIHFPASSSKLLAHCVSRTQWKLKSFAFYIGKCIAPYLEVELLWYSSTQITLLSHFRDTKGLLFIDNWPLSKIDQHPKNI